MEKLKNKEIPEVKSRILKEQNYQCLLCRIDLRKVESRNICLDHDHRNGLIRGVLCRNCNGVIGKIENLATRAKKDLTHVAWLSNATEFLERTSKAPAYDLIHPTHKTEAQKRELRNRRARANRKRNVNKRSK